MKLLLSLLIGFFSFLPYITAQQSNPAIQWPAGFEPAESKFFVHNEIEISATPERVWAVLIDAQKWESYYKGAKNVVFVNAADSLLSARTVFNWETMGLKFQSSIKAFEPARYLAWLSEKKQIQGYHVWLIVPTASGCKLITEESQNGWLTFFEKVFQPKKLKRLHDVWLQEIKQQAESTKN